MKFNQVLNNFTSGVWSSRMLVNTDLEQYKRSCKEMTNMFVMKQGGAFRRPGSIYAAMPEAQQDFLTNNNNLMLIPWVLSNGDRRIIVADNGLPDGRWFVVNVKNEAFVYIGTISATTAANKSNNNVESLHYTQIGDEIFLTGSISQTGGTKIPPRVIYEDINIRLAIPWTKNYGASEEYKGVPYLDPISSNPSKTIAASAVTGTITLTANFYFFLSGHENSYIKLTAAGATGIVRITSVLFGPSLTATGFVVKTLPLAGTYGSASGTSWEIAAWNDAYGYPTTCTAHEQRLFYGSHLLDPNVVFASRAGEPYEMMEIPLADTPEFVAYASDNSRPFSFYPSSSDGSIVRVLSAAKSLFIGTERNEILGRGVQNAIGPTDITLDSSTSFGSDNIQPVRADNFNTFVQKDGKTIRDIIYSYENEQYKAVDISFTANDFFIGKNVKQLASGVINGTTLFFVVMNDGSLIAATLERELQIVAWNKMELGGNALVKSVMAVPSAKEDKSDVIVLLVQRVINGESVVYMEYFDNIFEKFTYSPIIDDPYVYVDSAKVFLAPGTATLSVPHLEGKTVSVLAEGNYIGEKVVGVGGTLVLPEIYDTVVVGLKYTSKLIPAPINMNTQIGNSQGLSKKVNDLYIKFWASKGATYGDPERGEYYPIGFTPASIVYGELPPLFTGEKRLSFPPGYSREKQIEIKTEEPHPLNVLSIVAEGVTYD